MEKKNVFMQKLQRICSFIIFVVLACLMFLGVTYVFRRTEYDREHMVGIKEEKALDMVYIGGSTVFVYWQPLKAWNDCGYTSYNYAVNSIQPEMLQYCVREVLNFQDPKLLVIGIRTFLEWDDAFREHALRNVSDSMDFFSLNRIGTIQASIKIRDKNREQERLPYYFDILKYHSNYVEVMSNPSNWQFWRNTKENSNSNKGWEWMISHQVLEKPEGFLTSERAELSKECLNTLQSLLDTCKESRRQVLFVVSPYLITKEHEMQFNAIKDIIEENGFQYLNANEYYDEMGVDFFRDFYNESHMNCFGAEKYTEFLEDYIEERYDLPDHRSEDEYENWNKDYERFSEEEKQAKRNTETLIGRVQNGIDTAEILRNTSSVFEWNTLVRNNAFQVVVAVKGAYPQLDKRYDVILQALGIDIETLKEEKNVLAALYADGNLTDLEKNEKNWYQYKVGELELQIRIDDEMEIYSDEMQYCTEDDGIYLLAVDKNLKCIADGIVLYDNAEGELELRHLNP